MKKILVISNYRSTLVVRPEAEIYTSLAKKGFDITIMTYGNADYVEKFKLVGIKVIDFHPEKKMDKKEIKFIKDELISGGYDFLHLYNNKAIVNGIQAAKGLDVKVVLYRGCPGNVKWYDPFQYVKYLHPRVDAIICNSIGVEDYLKRHMLISKSDLVTINKGHDVNWYNNVEPIDRTSLNIPKDAIVVVSVGNYRPLKGVEYLIEAFNYLDLYPNVHLLLIGKHHDHPNIVKSLDGHSQKDRIHVLGYREDVLNIVASSDIFVLSSYEQESITKSVIEAMSLAKVPIITNLPGNKELVSDHENGLIVPVKDSIKLSNAIQYLVEHPTERKQMSEKAFEHIQNTLSHERTVQAYADFYETYY